MLAQLCPHLARGQQRRAAGDHQRAAGERAPAIGRAIGVAVDHPARWSGATPTSSAMICASVVRRPWPCGEAPMRASTKPEGSMVTSTVSQPGVISMPRAANAGVP